MNMIIAIMYIFFCDISSTVENYLVNKFAIIKYG